MDYSQQIAEMSLIDVIDAIEENLPKLSDKDRVFFKSLRESKRKYHGLTPKQDYWVRVLLHRAHQGKPELQQKEVGSMKGLYRMFQKAKEKLKYPAIMLQAEDGSPVKIHPFGPSSKYKGQLCVTDGKPFGKNKFFGAVNEAGVWSSYSPNSLVQDLLEKMASDPAGTAKNHAKLTGRCCFCNLPLSDEKSTAAGFGPVCADHFGLKEEWKKGVSLWETMAQQEGA